MARGAVEVVLKRGEYEDRGRGADGPQVSSAFEAFYREQYPPVVRLALSVLGRPDAAEDVAQEVFTAAHRRFRGDVERPPGGCESAHRPR